MFSQQVQAYGGDMDAIHETEQLVPELANLVSEATITNEQAFAVQHALRLGMSSTGMRNRRALWSEAFTYLGGAVIVVSAGLILSRAWTQLGTWGRPVVVGIAASVLFVAATYLARSRRDDVMRRLCSTLFVGASALVAFTIGLIFTELWVPKNSPNSTHWIDPDPWVPPTIVMLCAFGAGGVAVFGYRRAKSAFGVMTLGVIVGTCSGALGVLTWVLVKGGSGDNAVMAGIFLMSTAVVWLLAVNRKIFREENAANLVGLAMIFIAGQMLRQQSIVELPAVIQVAIGLILFYVYLRKRAWPFLAAGLLFLLSGGIELVTRYVQGILGACISLIFGIVLLVTGLRLFRDKSSESVPPTDG